MYDPADSTKLIMFEISRASRLLDSLGLPQPSFAERLKQGPISLLLSFAMREQSVTKGDVFWVAKAQAETRK